MALLEKIKMMQQAGISDSQIVNSLKEDGNSPRQILEAFSQLKIKSAVAPDSDTNNTGGFNGDEQMQQSIVPPESASGIPVSQQMNYAYSDTENQQAQQFQQNSQFQNAQGQQNYGGPYSQQYAEQARGNGNYEQGYAYPDNQYPAEGQYYSEEGNQAYDNGQYPAESGYYQQGMDIETVRDISRQELDEGLKKINEQIESLAKFKSETNFQVQNIENRLQKIESIIQEIQISIIKKMGEYGEAVSSLSDELQETQKSFSKVINPLFDKQRNKEKEKESKEISDESPRSSSKPKPGVENFFR